MTDPRKPVFDAIRAALGRRLVPADVPIVHAALDKIGMARDGDDPKPPSKGKLAAIIGVPAALALVATVNLWESGGKDPPLTAYLDIVGVWTICDGDTQGVKAGDRDTLEGCRIRLDTRLAEFAAPVLACTPNLRGHDNQTVAAISLAYNIGVAGYCRSTADRRFDTGDWRGGCDAILLWNRAGGRVVNGLARRREAERRLCLTDLPKG